MVFIDIKYHIGSIISRVPKHNRTIKIFGGEAIPKKVAGLWKNFCSVEFFGYALRGKAGSVSFYINQVESGHNSLLKSEAKPGSNI